MAERKSIFRRKSQLFLTSISPVTNTYDELVKEKLETGKFPTTKTGIIKITGVLILLFGLAFFLGQPRCENTASWYRYLYPASLGASILVQLILFFIFSLGLTIKRAGVWIYMDYSYVAALRLTHAVISLFYISYVTIWTKNKFTGYKQLQNIVQNAIKSQKQDVVLNLLFSLNAIIASVLTLKECSDQGSLTKIPAPFGIAGGVVLIISCGAIFLMYRYIDDEIELTTPPPSNPKNKRSGSIFA